MNIQIKTSNNKSWGKCLVTGKVFGCIGEKQVQEHLETIYYLGWWRVILRHDLKFKLYNINQ